MENVKELQSSRENLSSYLLNLPEVDGEVQRLDNLP